LIELFSVLDEIPSGAPEPVGPVHWSVRLSEIARRSSDKLAMPPGPGPEGSDVNRYWANKSEPFPIEEMQKRNTSVFHMLLNALIEIEDEGKAKTERTHPRARRSFLKGHALLPEIPCDPYLGLSFEDRLTLELESLDLGHADGDVGPANPPFHDDIKGLLDELDKSAVPVLRELEPIIRQKMPKFRQIQARRIATRAAIERQLEIIRART
jgi:hypothetical protein